MISTTTSSTNISLDVKEIFAWAVYHPRRERAWPKWPDSAIVNMLIDAGLKNRLIVTQTDVGSKGLVIFEVDKFNKVLYIEHLLCDNAAAFDVLLNLWAHFYPTFKCAGVRRGRNVVQHKLTDFRKE